MFSVFAISSAATGFAAVVAVNEVVVLAAVEVVAITSRRSVSLLELSRSLSMNCASICAAYSATFASCPRRFIGSSTGFCSESTSIAVISFRFLERGAFAFLLTRQSHVAAHIATRTVDSYGQRSERRGFGFGGGAVRSGRVDRQRCGH